MHDHRYRIHCWNRALGTMNERFCCKVIGGRSLLYLLSNWQSISCRHDPFPPLQSNRANYLPSPARFTPPATSLAPFSMLVETSEIPLATGRPALPVAPSTVSPTPLPSAPTTPPRVFVTPPTVLPTVEVTNLTPLVTPDSCWPIGIVIDVLRLSVVASGLVVWVSGKVRAEIDLSSNGAVL